MRQIVLYRFGSDLRQRELSEYRAEKLQRIHILLMIANASEWRFRTPLQKPIGPLIECELLAGQDRRQASLVSGIQTIPQEPLGLLTIGCACRLSYDFSFLVLVTNLPKL